VDAPSAAQTLTFLFTDVEGSTAMLQRLGGAYAEVLAGHHAIVRSGLAAHHGREVDTQGDAFFAVFGSPSDCVAAAVEIQRALAAYRWPADDPVRVRMGVHTGEVAQTAVGLVGLEVHRAARIAAVAHGGQIAVSAAAAALLSGSLPRGTSLRDLGLHRLKDLGGPERIFQVDADGLPSAFPPLASLDNPKLRNNLPAQVSSFIGRDSALAEVRRLITRSRLVTLTGVGGAGKTRLGLQAAAGLLDGSGDGVWFTDLAPLQGGELVAAAAASVLGVREEAGRPVTETLVEAVGDRSLLVLLDNCEHVVDACAKLADALLRGCPNIVLLATSREPLGIDGEYVYRVPPMTTPAEGDTVDAIRGAEAVRLFADRAEHQGVRFAWDLRSASLAGRICRRLDGIPLAIELAAARLRVMSLAELDARLDQRFSILTGGSRAALPRQQTLRAMVDWSWELLTAAERHVLAGLSVFAGGFDLGAAEAVSAGDIVMAGEVLGHLGALVDKNLVHFDTGVSDGDTGIGNGAGAGTARYRLLETVREYALRRLEGHDRAAADEVARAHRDHYLALSCAAAPRLIAHDQAEWLDRLELELDNIRAAIAFSLRRADATAGIGLAASLRIFWRARGHASEGADALLAMLDLPGAHGATVLRATALASAAYLLEQTGGYAAAAEYCDEAMAIARSAGDDELAADAAAIQAFVLVRQGQQAAALPLTAQALSLARRLGDPHLTARLLSARSYAVSLEGDHEEAAADAAESLRMFRQAGDLREVGTMLGNLGYAEMSLGELDTALGRLRESLAVARDLADSDGVVYATFNLGLAEYLSGSPGVAATLFTESFELAGRLRMHAGTAYALLGLAVAGGGADPVRSARLHGAADAALAALGETVDSLEARLRDADRERLIAAMGGAAFDAQHAAGRAMSAEEIAGILRR
jgi:predicted ATPase/class 3 adenylate cyclase